MITGAERWLINNLVDVGASRVFLALDRDQEDAIRNQGTLPKYPRNLPKYPRNPSAALMKRIHDRVGYVPLSDDCAIVNSSHEQELACKTPHSYLKQSGPRKEIALLVRGEPHRVGHCQEHLTGQSSDVFLKNIQSYAQFLPAPLDEKDYKVTVFVDVMGDPARESEVTDTLRAVFGDACRIDKS